ncbi:hypothetical protein DFH09DRAFT_993351, partial [Mycena vulgaris]
MIAFAVGGTPITTLIGTNESHLVWTVRHPIGTQLVLGVVDSQGNSGGIDAPVYTVTEGATTQCLPATDTEPLFRITANVTDTLTTCQPWGLKIQGGTPPYNLTLAALNSADVRNITLGPNDSEYTYINRADPGTHMIASVSDRTGRWAVGSTLVHTQGSSDVDCMGMVSSSSSGISIAGRPRAPISQHMSRARIVILAAASLGSLLVFCGIAIWAMQWRRRSRSRRKMADIAPFRALPSGGDHPMGGHITIPPQFIPAPL